MDFDKVTVRIIELLYDDDMNVDKEKPIGLYYTTRYKETLDMLLLMKEKHTDVIFKDSEGEPSNFRWFVKDDELPFMTEISDIHVEFSPNCEPTIFVYV